MLHALKIWPEFFAQVRSGHKTAEIRKDDRGFTAGDEIVLQEYNPEARRYTGQEWRGYITNVARNFKGLGKGFAVLSIKSIADFNRMRGNSSTEAIRREAFPQGGEMEPPPARPPFAPEAIALNLPE